MIQSGHRPGFVRGGCFCCWGRRRRADYVAQRVELFRCMWYYVVRAAVPDGFGTVDLLDFSIMEKGRYNEH